MIVFEYSYRELHGQTEFVKEAFSSSITPAEVMILTLHTFN